VEIKMEKLLVLTVCVGNESKSIASITHKSIKAYAEKIGAEFKIIDECKSSSPHWEKFQIHDLLNKYDRILYLDSDLIVREDCPNLFSIVPYSKIGLFDEAKYAQRQFSIFETAKAYEIKVEKWNGKYFNTGVLVVSKCHKKIFKKPETEFSSFYEQGYFNLRIAFEEEHRDPKDPLVFELNYRYNRMTCLDVTGEDRHESYIIHYAGYHYFTSLEGIVSLIKKDLEKWKKDSPNFKYKRHILIEVNGGLGDQICAEPAIRFLKKMYAEDDITIKTHWPRLFDHLNIPTFHHNKFVYTYDTPYYKISTLPGPETVNWSVVSNLMCHTVDYCAMAMLHRIFPAKEKTIQLQVTNEDYKELESTLNGFDITNCVIIHAGRHWNSKTFPVEWWQELITKISKKIPVCLIGMNNEKTRGVCSLDLPSNSIDLVDRTSLGSLIAAVSKAPLLLSNDSAPVHIAGAFNNWIILIPSCKHPEHVLPYREGTVWYKAKALYKALTLDDVDQRPTAWFDGGTSGAECKRSWDAYLPSIDQVCLEVINTINNSK